MANKKDKCTAMNVVPLSLPAAVPAAFRTPDIPAQCEEAAKQAKGEGSMCFAALEGPETDGGPSADISPNDPEDPVYYGSSFKFIPPPRVFSGPTCGAGCELGTDSAKPAWRVGHKCLGCKTQLEISSLHSAAVPNFAIADICENCDEVTVPTQEPTPATPAPTPEPTYPCAEWCATNEAEGKASWAQICTWKACMGCGHVCPDPSCSTGFKGSGKESDLCCAESCGVCGNNANEISCGQRPGGGQKCCSGNVRKSGSCDEHGPPCIITEMV